MKKILTIFMFLSCFSLSGQDANNWKSIEPFIIEKFFIHAVRHVNDTGVTRGFEDCAALIETVSQKVLYSKSNEIIEMIQEIKYKHDDAIYQIYYYFNSNGKINHYELKRIDKSSVGRGFKLMDNCKGTFKIVSITGNRKQIWLLDEKLGDADKVYIAINMDLAFLD
ncbi:hypothetical protein AGMMS49928_07420 [Spirochaetia bacterium]|nr:hypothetical protein AGMMS49928_07420 [Spirochaetia bacterium]